MRRLVSILLLLLLSMPAALPVLAGTVRVSAGDDASLPACCRRDGAHHCAMSMAAKRRMAARVRTLTAPDTPCPFCLHFAGFVAHGPLFAEPPPALFASAAPYVGSLLRRGDFLPLSSALGAHPPRGPPSA